MRPTGSLELMQDLGSAGPARCMLGGGNPARIPAVEAVYAPAPRARSPPIRRSSAASPRRTPRPAGDARLPRARWPTSSPDATAGR
ncbi:MAG: hypothetical protein MZW92_53935 [Comamonadaceae bacterium]|nr:hypothetical protein [Comamonadaceae bacterium]